MRLNIEMLDLRGCRNVTNYEICSNEDCGCKKKSTVQYELLKNLPGLNSGSIYTRAQPNSNLFLPNGMSPAIMSDHLKFTEEYIKAMPAWFQVKEKAVCECKEYIDMADRALKDSGAYITKLEVALCYYSRRDHSSLINHKEIVRGFFLKDGCGYANVQPWAVAEEALKMEVASQ